MAILGNSLKVFNFHNRWVEYRTSVEALLGEFYRFDAGVGSYATQDVHAFAAAVEQLIAAADKSWSETHTPAAA
jgi:hypothetical protein